MKLMETIKKAIILAAIFILSAAALCQAEEPVTGRVFLTFDDGPSKYTEQFLDVLKKNNVRACFFVVGERAFLRPDILRRMRAEGHTIAAHTWSHDYKKIYSSPEAYILDFKKTDDEIFKATGERAKFIRFPGGSVCRYNRRVRPALISKIEKMGLKFYDWNATGGDSAPNASRRGVLNNVLSLVRRNGDTIVLMHDTSPITLSALGELIVRLRDRGFVLEPLTSDVEEITFVKHRAGRKPAA